MEFIKGNSTLNFFMEVEEANIGKPGRKLSIWLSLILSLLFLLVIISSSPGAVGRSH